MNVKKSVPHLPMDKKLADMLSNAMAIRELSYDKTAADAAADATGIYKRGCRKCLYCLQPLYEHHKAPCEQGVANRVDQFDALYIDEKK